MRGTPEKIKAYMQGYYQRNKERCRERNHENYIRRKNKRKPTLPQTPFSALFDF
jgi:hypothetical protein